MTQKDPRARFSNKDVLTLFGEQPDAAKSAEAIAQQVKRNYKIVWPELGDLVLLGVLDKRIYSDQTLYQLADDTSMRLQVIRFAAQHFQH